MERPKSIKVFITNHPDEIIGYYGSGSDSYLFISIPLTFFAVGMCNVLSYGASPLVALALFAWYKVFTKNIYFIVNNTGIAMQSAFGYFKCFYHWSEIAAFHFTVKFLNPNLGAIVENKIVFKKKAGDSFVLRMNGMEKQFDEIHRKLERLTARQNIINEGVVQLRSR
jgi:hypothetical protein